MLDNEKTISTKELVKGFYKFLLSSIKQIPIWIYKFLNLKIATNILLLLLLLILIWSSLYISKTIRDYSVDNSSIERILDDIESNTSYLKY